MNTSILTITTTTLALLLPATASAERDELEPFSDFRINGSVGLGTGHNVGSGQTLSANVGLGVFVPLVQNFGLRANVSFLSQPSLDAIEGGGAALLTLGAGLDYTIGLGAGDTWGLGMAAGAGYVPLGFVEGPGFGTTAVSVTGVDIYQELALRRAIRVGVWSFGLRADEFFGSGTQITNVAVFFRFAFRL